MHKKEKGQPENKAAALFAVLQMEAAEADCDRAVAQIEAYVTTQLAGQSVDDFAWLQQHLDGCTSCAAAYARVYDMQAAEARGDLWQPDVMPAPDLSFLQQPGSLWAALQAALQQTQSQLSLQLNAALVALLAPPAPQGVTRSEGDGRFGKQLLALTPEQLPEADLPVSLAVYADRDAADRCLVEVTVEPPGRSWPDLGGCQVTLSAGPKRQTAVTDDWGTAVFTDILQTDLANLRFDISW